MSVPDGAVYVHICVRSLQQLLVLLYRAMRRPLIVGAGNGKALTLFCLLAIAL